jgi:hypothetical protein
MYDDYARVRPWREPLEFWMNLSIRDGVVGDFVSGQQKATAGHKQMQGLSTTQRTMKLSSASVEMTLFVESKKATTATAGPPPIRLRSGEG